MRRCAGFAIQEQEVQAQWIAGERQHAAQLAGAEHADGPCRVARIGLRQHGVGLCLAVGGQCSGHACVLQRHYGSGEQGGIGCPGRADGKGGHRNALGHLHDRQQ